jgi:Flp pilus assembly protein TadD
MGEKKRRMQAAASIGIAADPAATLDYDDLVAHARTLRIQGRLGEAIKRCERASSIEPERHEAIHLLGMCYFDQGARDVGLSLLRRAVTLRPDAFDERVTYAYSLSAASRFGQAAEELRGLAALAPANAQIRRDLGAILVNLGEFRDAERWFREAANLAPERADVHEALAGLLYRHNELDGAQRAWSRAAELDPSVARRIQVGSISAPQRLRQNPSNPNPERGSAPAWTLVERAATAALDDAALRRACAERELVILDDALPDPMAYRERALALDYVDSSGTPGINFPGRQTRGQPCAPIMERIAELLDCDLKWLSPDNGAFRWSGGDSRARSDIHVDSNDGSDGPMLAGLLYLTLPEHCRGGTGFWRHRATGWEQRPDDAELRRAGYASFEDFERRCIHAGAADAFSAIAARRGQQWDCLFQVPLRFNRLAVYRADYFHAVGDVFGAEAADSRLVQLFYFKRARSTAAAT